MKQNTMRLAWRGVLLATAGLLAAAPAFAQTSVARSLAATCANCHGTDGHAKDGMKTLAGKPADEIIKLVSEFRTGQRPATIMHQISKGYTEDQIKMVAEYFAQQPAK